MIRIFIAADSNERADALAAQLEEDDRFEISEIELADVILCVGIARTRLPARGRPVVAVSDHADDEAAFDDTIRAWLPPAARLEDISAALTAAAAGLTVLTKEQAKRTFRTSKPSLDEQLAEVEHLTAREQEVLQMVAAGLGNKEIAARLHISPNTAKFHVRQILAKLDAESRTQAVSMAIRRGLIPI